jgi:hypothetical protein
LTIWENPDVNPEFEIPGQPAGMVIDHTQMIQFKTRTKAIQSGYGEIGSIVCRGDALTSSAFRNAEIIVTFHDILNKPYEARGILSSTVKQK